MIPILFETNETDFNTNGIGRIPDAISCKVTEERNGIYELQMEYPLTGQMFNELKYSRIIYAVPSDGKSEQPFRIYKITKPMNGRISIYAEHISYQMLHVPVAPFSANSVQEALLKMKSHAIEKCPFEFWTDKSTVAAFSISEPANMRSKLVGSRGSILDVYGGELEYDKYKVSLHNKRGVDNGIIISYGKNLTDLKQEENIQNTFTGIVPYYKASDGSILMLPEKTVSSKNASNFPYNRTVPMDFSSEFEEKPTIEQLRAVANAYVKNNAVGVPTVSISVSFQQLWQTEEYASIAPLERVNLCDTVSILYEKLGVSATARVNKTIYNVLLNRYDSIELGDAKSSISDRIIEQNREIDEKPSTTFLEQAILNATEQITGIKGGYIVFRYDANQQPYEMLIMDTPEMETAKNVWRFNQGGIGHSSSGYEGPFSTAITQDGKIVADFITTGTLLANLIKVGILSDAAGKNYWNMETGELVTRNIKVEDGSILANLIKVGILSDAAGKNYWNMETGELVTNNMTIKGGKVNIESEEAIPAFIKLSYADKVARLGTGCLGFETGRPSSGGRFVEFGNGTMDHIGLTIGNWSHGFGDVYTEKAAFGLNKETGKIELFNSDYPTFTFTTSDNKTVKVRGGVICEVS